jgi:hypothetical protein
MGERRKKTATSVPLGSISFFWGRWHLHVRIGFGFAFLVL